jgi:hypothetical protein
MPAQRQLVSLAACGLLIASASAARFVGHSSHAPAACTLLTAADASKALERTSQAGKEIAGPSACVWSDDPAASDSSRRVTVSTHALAAFRYAMHPAIKTIAIEPVSGIGDEAFYQIYPKEQSPFIWVRKGDAAFAIRILTGSRPRPFTLDQEKAKEAVLAKAAVARF